MANNPSEDRIAEYSRTKKSLDDIKEKRGKSAILGSQSVWLEQGEHSNAHFLRMAKK